MFKGLFNKFKSKTMGRSPFIEGETYTVKEFRKTEKAKLIRQLDNKTTDDDTCDKCKGLGILSPGNSLEFTRCKCCNGSGKLK